MTRDEIIKEALALPADDRLLVADSLESSLSSSGFATPEIHSAWMQELERRISAYERGDVQALPADAALSDIRKQLEAFRASRTNP